MEEARVDFNIEESYPSMTFQNSCGLYKFAPHDAVIRSIEEFFYGASNLKFHAYYYNSQKDKERQLCKFIFHFSYRLIFRLEYLFSRYKNFEEYYSESYEHMWYLAITTEETGRTHKLWIQKDYQNTTILIGERDIFDKMEYKYQDIYLDDGYRGPDKGWQMETAVEDPSEAADSQE